MKRTLLRVGYILKPQGIRGELKIQPLTDDVRRFEGLKEVYLETVNGCEPRKLTVNRIEEQFMHIWKAAIRAKRQSCCATPIYA